MRDCGSGDREGGQCKYIKYFKKKNKQFIWACSRGGPPSIGSLLWDSSEEANHIIRIWQSQTTHLWPEAKEEKKTVRHGLEVF